MDETSVAQRFAALDEKQDLAEYNFEHFRTRHFLSDVKWTLTDRGVLAGERAPDFDLRRVDGGRLRLADLRGAPTVLHFGSYT